MIKITKKRTVLFALFILPLILYIWLSTGINNFAKLPVISKNITDIQSVTNDSKTLQNKISIICFLGDDAKVAKARLFNLNQKIYKPFYGFKDFQIVVVYQPKNQLMIDELYKELAVFTDMKSYQFVALAASQIQGFYDSFQLDEPIENLESSKAYIVDKELNLRGRTSDEDVANGLLVGYNMNSVAELNNKMKDDVKIVLAEYRLALKKNNANREI